jgi:hypothetical protein
MKEILLTRNKIALVDDEDYERVSQFKWCAVCLNGGRWYAQSNSFGLPRQTLLHRFILELKPDDPEVDHISGDGLDCRRLNMRLATRQQNLANRFKFSGKYSSKYKGVTWSKRDKKWIAQIMVNYKNIRLGSFVIEEDAARAYDKAAIQHFGEYARLNFPREDYE